MSEPLTSNDFFKSLPSASELDSKKVLMTDAQGGIFDADMMRIKCHLLFGIDTVISRKRNTTPGRTLSGLKNEFDKETQWYSEFNTSTPVGICVTISFLLETGGFATMYALTLDAISTNSAGGKYRTLRPLMLEVPGYAPYWNPHAVIT